MRRRSDALSELTSVQECGAKGENEYFSPRLKSIFFRALLELALFSVV